MQERPDADPHFHFGALVSRISHRWRSIVLVTANAWMWIRCNPYSKASVERAAEYLSRSKAMPVDIHIARLVAPIDLGLFQDSVLNMERCHWLCIESRDNRSLDSVLEYTSHQMAPLLRSLTLSCRGFELSFTGALFPFGAPQLKIVQLACLGPNTADFCLPAFQSVTHMELKYPDPADEDESDALGRFLAALKSLHHLELTFEERLPLPQQPIVLLSL